MYCPMVRRYELARRRKGHNLFLRYYTRICLEGVREILKTLRTACLRTERIARSEGTVIIILYEFPNNYSLMTIQPFLTFTCIYYLFIYATSVHPNNISRASSNHQKEALFPPSFQFPSPQCFVA